MKNNLKNKPKGCHYDAECEEWFEGFEKELRGILEDLRGEDYMEVFREADRIKEILGE